MLDLRHLNSLRIEQRENGVWATIGAGCQVKRVVLFLLSDQSCIQPGVLAMHDLLCLYRERNCDPGFWA